jgi:Cu/Ag efflux pump CusA
MGFRRVFISASLCWIYRVIRYCGTQWQKSLIAFEDAQRRLRPVLMTASIAVFWLIPLLFATGPGSEIQRPLAIVVISGLITSTILTLFILPILYHRFFGKDD